MYNPRGLQQYKHDDISSMPREKIVVLLYERLIADLQDSITATANDDRLTMTKALNHANRIVSELRLALNHDIGGDIARNLDSLYNYVFSETLEQLVDRDPTHARNCIEVLVPLLESWRQIPVGTADRAARDQELGTKSASESVKETAAPHLNGQEAGAAEPKGMTGSLSVSA